jgi:hypothetical protein
MPTQNTAMLSARAVLGTVGLPAPLHDLAAQHWDVFVVGAGQSGLACAAYLARGQAGARTRSARARRGCMCARSAVGWGNDIPVRLSRRFAAPAPGERAADAGVWLRLDPRHQRLIRAVRRRVEHPPVGRHRDLAPRVTSSSFAFPIAETSEAVSCRRGSAP